MYTPQHTEQRTGPKILLVEDQRLYRQIAAQCLVKYERIMAKDATSALKLFEIEQPDITFLDIMLPDGNGLDLLKTFRQIRASAYIVMVTSSTEMADFREAEKLGAAGFIRKPFNNAAVIKQLEHYKLYGTPAAKHQYTVVTPVVQPSVPKEVATPPKLSKTKAEMLKELAASLNIICVDYDKVRATSLQDYFAAKYGCQVQIVRQYEAANDLLKLQACDIIMMMLEIVDQHGCRQDGCQFADALRREQHNTSTIVGMLTTDPADTTDKWRAAGVDQVLHLPFKVNKLDKLVTDYLNARLSKQQSVKQIIHAG